MLTRRRLGTSMPYGCRSSPISCVCPSNGLFPKAPHWRICGSTSRAESRRIVFGVAAVGSFLALFFLAAALFVEFEDPREETTSDGGVVSVGASWPGKFDGCVVDASQTILSNCSGSQSPIQLR